MSTEESLQDLMEAIAAAEAAGVDTFPSVREYIARNVTDMIEATAYTIRGIALRAQDKHEERMKYMGAKLNE